MKGYQVTTSLLVGKYGKYPITFTIYKKSDRNDPEFKTKIEIQKRNIEEMIENGLNFTTVVGDSWYFTKEIVEFLNDKGKS